MKPAWRRAEVLIGLKQCVEPEELCEKVGSREEGRDDRLGTRQSKVVSSDSCPLFKWLNVAGLWRNNRVRVILMGCDAYC